MATWKKVLVSGSSIAVNEITASGHINAFTSSVHSIGPITSSGGISASGNYVGKSNANSFIGTASYADQVVGGTQAGGKILIGNDANVAVLVTPSGDVTMNVDGVNTIAAGAVHHSMLADDIISGQGAMTAVAQADLVMVDDGPGTVKKITFSNFEDQIFGNVSGDATIAAGGGLTIANDAVTGAMIEDNPTIAGNLTVNGTTALGNNTADHVTILGNVTSSGTWALGNGVTDYITVAGNITGSAAGTISQSRLITDEVTGVGVTGLTLTTNVTASGQISASLGFNAPNLAIGFIGTASFVNSLAGAGITDGKFLVGNGSDEAAEVNMSGDATMDNAGAVTIAASAVEHGMLNDNIISGQGAMTAVAQADLLMVDDGPGTVKKITFSNFEDQIFGNVSGDATVAAGGGLTIANTSVETGMLAADAVTNAKLADDAVETANIADDAVTGDKLANDIVIANDLTVTGDLLVSGDTTTLHTANLTVEDKFIMVASSSGAPNVDGGMIVQTTNLKGAGIGYDNSAERWVVTGPDVVAQDATAFAANAAGAPQMLVQVSHSAAAPSGNPIDFGTSATTRIGMMHVETDTGDIYIFS